LAWAKRPSAKRGTNFRDRQQTDTLGFIWVPWRSGLDWLCRAWPPIDRPEAPIVRIECHIFLVGADHIWYICSLSIPTSRSEPADQPRRNRGERIDVGVRREALILGSAPDAVDCCPSSVFRDIRCL